jgi:hypothetical protein
MDKTLFFGYGAYKDKKRIEVIFRISGFTGDDLEIEGGFGARTDGYVLAIQNLQQIPEASRKSLMEVWGGNFRCYTIKPGIGQVAGVLWTLNEKQFQALKEWECDGVWREFVEVEVITTDQHKLTAFADKAINDNEVAQIVDGLNYESNLNLEGMKKRTNNDDSDEYRIQELQKVRTKLAQVTTQS